MQELNAKLKYNSERRERELLLNQCNNVIKEILKNCDYIYSEDYFKKLSNSPFPNFKEGRLITSDNFKVYLYFEYDDPVHVYGQIQRIKITLCNPLFIYLGKGPVFKLSTSIPNIPFDSFFELMERNIVDSVYISDMNSGLIIDSYCGHLITRPPSNCGEVVYEIVYFQTDK